MSRLFIFLNIVFVLIATTTSSAESSPKPKPRPNQKPPTFVLPVFKDYNSYYTNVTVGDPPLVITLTIATSGDALWFPCIENGYKSTTYTHTLCGSSKCKKAKGKCSTCSGSYAPTCRNNTCVSHLYYGTSSYLLEDGVTLSYMSTSAKVAPKLTTRVPLACMAEYDGVDYIPYTGSRGFIGLTKDSMSLVNSLVSSHKIPFKVALCLPSKDLGLVYIGSGPYMLLPNGKDVSGLLVSTPLIRLRRGDLEDSYYIDVKSIQFNGKTLSLNPDLLTLNKSSETGGTMINEGVPYTYLESSIYKTLVNAFSRNAKKREAVAPFDDCFSSSSFGGKMTPVISLILKGGAKWNIYGANSLVKVNKSLVCLAFMDGGEGSYRPAFLIGGYQMQDNLVEFDLEASKFSITSSLLLHNTSCSRL